MHLASDCRVAALPAGFWAPRASAPYECVQCPLGGICRGKAAFPYAKQGYWTSIVSRNASDSRVYTSLFIPCKAFNDPDTCLEGAGDNVLARCKIGYTGPAWCDALSSCLQLHDSRESAVFLIVSIALPAFAQGLLRTIARGLQATPLRGIVTRRGCTCNALHREGSTRGGYMESQLSPPAAAARTECCEQRWCCSSDCEGKYYKFFGY